MTLGICSQRVGEFPGFCIAGRVRACASCSEHFHSLLTGDFRWSQFYNSRRRIYTARKHTPCARVRSISTIEIEQGTRRPTK